MINHVDEACAAWSGANEEPGARAGRRGRLLEPPIANIRGGRLRIVLPDGRSIISAGEPSGLQATLVIDRWRALRRLAFGGDGPLAHPHGVAFGDREFQNLNSLIGATLFGGQNAPFGP